MKKTKNKLSKSKKCKWVKDKVNYFSFHQRLRSYYGSDLTCVYCNSKKNVEFASISQKALHDFSDYMTLCRSCHRKYDKTFEKRDRDVYGRFV